MAEEKKVQVRSEKRAGAVRLLADMRTTQVGMRLVTLTALAAAAVVCLVSVIGALSFANQNRDRVYVLDEGAALELRRAENGEQKDLEVVAVVTRFHELFYNVAPNLTMINANVERALELADESAYRVYADLKEQSYYSYMIQNDITQQVYVDSVAVDVMGYPYKAKAHCSLYVHRDTKDFLYTMQSQCELIEVPRSRSNPNGLMITRYVAEDPVLVNTVSR